LNVHEDRVKSCLACDRLIAFNETVCSFCGSDQAPAPSRKCRACGAALTAESLHCPKCTVLNVPTADFSLGEDSSMTRILRGQKAQELVVWGIEILTLSLVFWVLMDLGALPLP